LVQRWDASTRTWPGKPQLVPFTAQYFQVLTDGSLVAGHPRRSDGRLEYQCNDGLQVWRTPRERAHAGGLLRTPDPTPALHWLPPVKGLVWGVASATPMAQAWDVATGRPAGVSFPAQAPFTVSRDGRLLAAMVPGTGLQTKTPVRVWDAVR